ncbi:hypothetical protein [Desulfovibrio sp. ZJ369]|uniref:hypothetical protein n=1 Tax=Desulfovibrio sp. ZJ369 TaxID=2709793 RepID=UPI00197F17C9|nr:hypothetical protein [Desulfovibrio sp. ZJ369]
MAMTVVLPAFAVPGSDLRQPDGSFHRFQLAEERPDAAELVMPPVLQQAGCFRRDLPAFGIREIAPCRDDAAQFVDARGQLIFLIPGGQRHCGGILKEGSLLLSQ